MAKEVVKERGFFSRNKVWIIVVAVVLVLLLYVVGVYNGLATLNQNVNSKWSEVENQYQRQFDLIPNLASVVTSAVKVETQYVKDIIAARTNYQGAQGQLAKDTAGLQMSNSVATLVAAVAENYPVLQANKQYTQLVDELAGTQNRITVARGRYIEAIQAFNTKIVRFPTNVVAGMFGFAQKDYYKANEGAMNTPVLGSGTLP